MPASKKTLILGLIVVFIIFYSVVPQINFSAAEKKYGNDAAQHLIDNYTNSFVNAMFPQVAAAQQIPSTSTNSINPAKTNTGIQNTKLPQYGEVKELSISSSIVKGIKDIFERWQFKPILSRFYDADGDGLNNHEDPHPEIHERIAQHHASELNIPPGIVDLLEPLNTGPERLRPWGEDRYIPTGDFPPQLDENEKDFIGGIALMDHTLQQQLVKLAAKGKITDRDLTIVDYINSLKNYRELDESYSSLLQEKVASAFQKEISTGAINTETVEQINFLSSLPLEEQVKRIASGYAGDPDWDRDGKSNYFEKFVGNKLVYNYLVPNDWYVIILDCAFEPDRNQKIVWQNQIFFFSEKKGFQNKI
jgi:hypothetical protein